VRPQADLLRLVAEEGQAVPGQGRPGRGCWLCRDPGCAKAALKTGQIPRALKGKAAAPMLDRLLQWMAEGAARSSARAALDGNRGCGLKS